MDNYDFTWKTVYPDERTLPMMYGIMNLNKPTGMTSRRAVDLVERLVRPAKAGHAGTLDPLACGVLVMCLGPATRLIEYVQQMPKRYRATFLLGQSSPTEDLEGEITLLEDPPRPTRDEIQCAAVRMTGEIQQRPPAFSALKIKGKRAYDLARSGKQVDLAERPVTIYELELIEYEYPQLVLDIKCSSGTYIRSFGRDLAESLGTAAVMSALTRTAIGSFTLEAACPVGDLTRDNLADHLLPALLAVESMPTLQLSPGELSQIANGQTIDRDPPPNYTEFAGLDSTGRLRSILAVKQQGKLGPKRNFPIPPA